ncbi:MAG: hypothetical protein ACYT04_35840, partial [Nostoc sp.]
NSKWCRRNSKCVGVRGASGREARRRHRQNNKWPHESNKRLPLSNKCLREARRKHRFSKFFLPYPILLYERLRQRLLYETLSRSLSTSAQ